MAIIKLKSSDGEIFDTDIEIAKRSGTIKTMLEDCGISDENEGDAIIPVPNVNSAILRLVLEWADHHKDDVDENDKPAEEDKDKAKRSDDISAWDATFLKVDQGTLFEIILAANFLDIKALLDTSCKTVANMIKGKTPEEIRKVFNIQNDFAKEELDQVGMENEWTREKK